MSVHHFSFFRFSSSFSGSSGSAPASQFLQAQLQLLSFFRLSSSFSVSSGSAPASQVLQAQLQLLSFFRLSSSFSVSSGSAPASQFLQAQLQILRFFRLSSSFSVSSGSAPASLRPRDPYVAHHIHTILISPSFWKVLLCFSIFLNCLLAKTEHSHS